MVGPVVSLTGTQAGRGLFLYSQGPILVEWFPLWAALNWTFALLFLEQFNSWYTLLGKYLAD